MKKKQEISKRLLATIDDKYCYDLIPGVVGFYHPEPYKILEKGLGMKKAVHDIVGMHKLLKDVQVVYSSMSNKVKQNSEGWITALWALEQFKVAKALEEEVSHEEYINLMDCLCYNMNVGAKAKRMALVMTATTLKHDLDGIQHLASSMLQQFGIDCQVNCNTILEMMQKNNTYHNFKQWYINVRPAIVNGVGSFDAKKHNGIRQAHKALRMDVWFSGSRKLYSDPHIKLSERQRVNSGVIELQRIYDETSSGSTPF